RVTYAALFEDYLQVDIHTAADAELARLGRERCDFQGELDRDGWLNLLFSLCIEPQLQQPTMVYAFPASQAALARVVTGDDRVPSAARFELFIHGMELANGYFELTDAAEQARRFAADQKQREALDRPVLPIDSRLLAGLQQGLPECAGVALGVDRLVMLAVGASRIDEVITFPFSRARPHSAPTGGALCWCLASRLRRWYRAAHPFSGPSAPGCRRSGARPSGHARARTARWLWSQA